MRCAMCTCSVSTHPTFDWLLWVHLKSPHWLPPLGAGAADNDTECAAAWSGASRECEPISASKSSIRRFVITEKAPTRATTAFTFKTLLRHYAKRALTPRSLNVKLGPRRNYHKGRAAIRNYTILTSGSSVLMTSVPSVILTSMCWRIVPLTGGQLSLSWVCSGDWLLWAWSPAASSLSVSTLEPRPGQTHTPSPGLVPQIDPSVKLYNHGEGPY